MTSKGRMGLNGKAVLVSGGATGVGRATAKHLCDQGASVIAVGQDRSAGLSLGDEMRALGRPFHFLEIDVRCNEQVAEAVQLAEREFGQLNGLVNSAAIHRPGKRLEDLTDEDWSATIDVNLTGVFRMCRAALPAIRRAGGGSIVNIASVHAMATVPGLADYAASKGAVLALSRQLAIDYACDRIRVNALVLGSVNTRMSQAAFEAAGGPEALGLSFAPTALPRIGSPDEVADIITFLLSDASSYINGSGLVADGGMLARLM